MNEQANPPVLVNLKGQPTSMNYWLVPKHKPDLGKNIKDVHWEAIDKTLNILVEETAAMDVFHWMEYMRERKKQAQEGPFINLDEDALMLKVCDGAEVLLACFRFSNLTLVHHQCRLSKDSVGYTAGSAMTHRLTIRYEEVHEVDLPQKSQNAQEAVDAEWQTV